MPELSGRALVVCLIKHSHKTMDIDRWAQMHELRGAEEPPLDYLLDRMQHCDLVLVEGFKNGGFPKLDVWRSAVGKQSLSPDWPGIVAIVCEPVDAQFLKSSAGMVSLDLSRPESIAGIVRANAALR